MKRAAVMAIGMMVVSAAQAADLPPVAEGPFQPSWTSLSAYQCPDWFRDAKFGIWAHWGAQCEPEQGDWYARSMYIEGTTQYQFHVAHYGHPSKFGFKDVCNEWKAERFDPEKLVALYKRAGAKYFVMMANHHCNFDNWNSKYQPWNSVAIGPKKDLVGMWEKAARAAGLRFGVTVHAARSWEWYEVAQLSDKSGPLAGVPYDGNLTKADGQGLWWDGLDPQDLYAQRHKTNSNPIDRKAKNRIPGDPPSPAYCEKFYKRVIDLLDSYKPDLLYFDDGVLPLRAVSEDYGLRIAAHLYNLRAKAGRTEAVMNTKGLNEEQRKCLVWDIERGVSGRVEPFVWQTDTCIGAWHYNRAIYDKHGYKTATQVIQMLADIVSKNGNLLLNVPVRGDGTIDEDEQKVLEDIADWMEVNGESIFGTRPWKIMGEGLSAAEKGEAGRFGGLTDVRKKPYSAEDFRFTTKDGALYAIAMAWPSSGRLVVRTLAAGAAGIQGEVKSVELLGVRGPLAFKREPQGLVVTLPAKKPCDHAFALKIGGLDLAASEPVVPEVADASAIDVRDDGSLLLEAAEAQMHGTRVKVETRGGKPNVGCWDKADEWISWKTRIPSNGVFEVTADISSLTAGTAFAVEALGVRAAGATVSTGAWDDYRIVSLGKIGLAKTGVVEISVRSADPKAWKAINLRSVKLTPVLPIVTPMP